MIRSGLDLTDFITENIDRLSGIVYGTVMSDDQGKIGKLRATVLGGFNDGVINFSPRLYALSVNGDFQILDCDDISYKDVEVGPLDEKELDEAISAMTERARKQLPATYCRTLSNLVSEFHDRFRVSLCVDPPVKVPPMRIELEGPERPVKVRKQTHSPEQLEFLKKKSDLFLKAGYIYKNPSTKWAYATLVVPKLDKEGFHFTVDLRPVNAQTKRNVWPMPHADTMLARLNGSKAYFNLDFIHGY